MSERFRWLDAVDSVEATVSTFEETFKQALEALPDELRKSGDLVPGTGPLDADVMLIGEAPGATEVERGEPFVGQAGSNLDRTLADLGVDRASLYLTNVVKLRPPDNRTPTSDEIATWVPVLEAEIAHVDPDVVVALGATAAEALLDVEAGISDVRGQVLERDGRSVVPTYHPAAMFYDGSKRDDFEADLRVALTDQ